MADGGWRMAKRCTVYALANVISSWTGQIVHGARLGRSKRSGEVAVLNSDQSL